ncbi:MAG TPA: hypothetical protein VF575_00055 [Candidatus Saccharimonadales bacterium]
MSPSSVGQETMPRRVSETQPPLAESQPDILVTEPTASAEQTSERPYIFGPRIVQALAAAEHVASGEEYTRTAAFGDTKSGTYGVIDVDENARRGIRYIKNFGRDIRKSLQSPVDPDNPEATMRQALEEKYVGLHRQPKNEDISVAAVKFFQRNSDKGGILQAVIGSRGSNYVLHEQRTSPQTPPISDIVHDSEVPTNEIQTSVRPVRPGERIIIISKAVFGALGATSSSDLLKDLGKILKENPGSKDAARALASRVPSRRGASAVVIDVPDGPGYVGNDASEVFEPQRTGLRAKMLGGIAVPATVGSLISRWQARGAEAGKQHMLGQPPQKVTGIGQPPIVPPADKPIRQKVKERVQFGPQYLAASGATWLAARRTGSTASAETKTEKRRFGKKALIATLIGGILIYKFGENFVDFGDGKDQGLDILGAPLPTTADIGQGDSSGYDLNPFNQTTLLNDDPANPTVSTIDRDPDILSAFFDGDGFDGGLFTKDPVVEVTAPRVSPPVEVLPDKEIVEVPKIEIKEPWTPDGFEIAKGEGLLETIHDQGHDLVGHKFNNEMTESVLQNVQDTFGNNIIELPKHTGPDTYVVNQDLRIASPGEAHWRTEAIERFIHDNIIKVAEETKTLQNAA